MITLSSRIKSACLRCFHRRRVRKALVSITLTLGILWLGLELGIRLVPFDPTRVDEKLSDNATFFLDRKGAVVWAQVNRDDKWRIQVPEPSISPHFIHSIIQTEDQHFYHHSGVDWKAAARAALQLVKNREIISGASTITMQLVRLTYPRESQGPWTYKLEQSYRAMHLERIRSKEWILHAYLNLLPFGGNIEGIEAASRKYYGIPAAGLDMYQSATLAAVPQNPNYLRPDRFPVRNHQRAQYILSLLDEKQLLPASVRLELALPYNRDVALRGLDLSSGSMPRKITIPECLSIPHSDSPHMVDGYQATSLDADAYRIIKDHINLLKQKPHGMDRAFNSDWSCAVVVIDNASGEVICEFGDLDPDRVSDGAAGYVNAARALRSPGSALKPWIYHIALTSGLITRNSRIADHWNGFYASNSGNHYTPDNFDGRFRGVVSASAALNHSLNIPAVQLLSRISPAALVQSLEHYEVLAYPTDYHQFGLTLALGSRNVRLLDLTRGYSILLNDVVNSESIPMRTADASATILDILAERHLPGLDSDIKVAWKTGTSNGNRDAWCFGVTPDWTLGVWVGNKSGAPDPNLIGYHSAMPILVDLINSFHSQSVEPSSSPTPWEHQMKKLPNSRLCLDSYLRATSLCPHSVQSQTIRGASANWCHIHSHFTSTTNSITTASSHPNRSKNFSQSEKITITSPSETTYYHIPENPSISFSFDFSGPKSTRVLWFLNGKYAGSSGAGHKPDIQLDLQPGHYTAQCFTSSGVSSQPVHFKIKNLDLPQAH